MRHSAVALETLRSMLARVPHPYEGADPVASRRVTAALVGLNSLLTVAFLAIDRPTHAIGRAGWLVAAAVVASSAGAVPRLVGSRRQAGFNELLAIAYAGAAGIALVQWLAGPESPYNLLLVLWLGTGAVHPPRRALVYLGVLIAITWLPVIYGDGDAMLVTHAAALSLLLLSIGAVLVTYLFSVRRQRLGLQAGVEVARRLARSDPLTGLGNRRAFDEALTVEIARAERSGEPLTVGLVDLDGLKRINDRFGHLEGDRCLRDTALAIERSLRATDACFRWGGDEFVVLLPHTDRDGGLHLLARVSDEVARTCQDPDGSSIELSYGAAELEPAGSAEDLLALADLALLDQKTEKQRSQGGATA
ncbi:MAG: GGDEF domain-containing protein [Nocardioidaceae bacterium]